MPAGGIISVAGKNVALPSGGDASATDRAVAITVTDTGTGFPAENIPRLFEPYFSARAGGRGLGLSIVHSIILRHGGALHVSSEPGKGTVFTVRAPASGVPASVGDVQPSRPPQRREEPAHKGTGRILVMDDDEIVRKACARMLSALGYECVLAPDGERALEEYKKASAAGKPFGAVIMDLTIPGGMGGEEAVLELRRLDPGARAIVSSGYADDPIAGEYREHGFDAALSKPYKLEELSRVLKDLAGPP
jgi:CheY-like chemotaxis protein